MSQVAAAPVAFRDVDRRGISMLALGHASVDTAAGAVPAMLPFLIDQRGYSYAAASALVLAVTFTSSLIQPLFGILADRRSLPWLLPGGVLMAAVGISVVGLLDSFALTFAAVALAGLGVGAFHPEAARYANYVSGDRRATGMSYFSVGGNVGFALGPILVTPLMLAFGLGGTVWLAVPMLLVFVLVVRELPRILSFRPSLRPRAAAQAAGDDDAMRDRWGPFARIVAFSGLRSMTYFGLLAFVPAYFIAEHHSSEGLANAALSALLVGGAIGTIVGGRIADRVGLRRIVVGCALAMSPLILLLLVAGPIGSFGVAALLGAVIVSTFSISVVLGQQYLPNRLGIASGVTLGAAIGIGGIVAVPLGALADAVGLTPTLLVIAALPLPMLLLALGLPADRRRPRRA